MTDHQIEEDLNDRYHAHLIVAQKKDELWDLCQKFVDKQKIINEQAAEMTALVVPGVENVEFLVSIAGLVGYANPAIEA